MQTYYKPKSKYYEKEVAFRSQFSGYQIKIEQHSSQWQAKNEDDIAGRQLLGYVGGFSPTRTKMIWIVAKNITYNTYDIGGYTVNMRSIHAQQWNDGKLTEYLLRQSMLIENGSDRVMTLRRAINRHWEPLIADKVRGAKAIPLT